MRAWKTPGPWKAPGLWKALGLAGVLGVAATGAVIVRAERRRRAYTPDEVRQRLHDRLDETPPEQGPGERR
ncbi:hypothetical protein ETD83_36040 [Actinomadura soli]|uniref:Uncharacterized protein n=1 Tax=Actinomadura soli TaxID=2508997 RepID=A0A5C4J0V7_9ACTN|nr:hypothetical protein [Actinomadura soli]TMQ90300.1 hypothetical protein ETD83_36040 [Actinomadura soli]